MEKQEKWLSFGDGTKQSIWLSLIICFACIAMHNSPVGEYLTGTLNKTIDFKVRSWLGKSPARDPRIKVFGIDDVVLSRMNYTPDFTLKEWSKIIVTLAKSKPKVIFIDKIFALPIGEKYGNPLSDKEANDFIESVKGAGVPVVVGGFTTQFDNKYRDQVPADGPLYTVNTLTAGSGGPSQADWISIDHSYFYGPHRMIVAAFDYVGTLDHTGFGEVRAIRRLSQQKVVGYASLNALGFPLSLQSDGLFVGTTKIPLDRNQNLVLNLEDLKEYQQGNLSLTYVLGLGDEHLHPRVNEGDYVVILPFLYTGNSDFKMTPIGKVQAGFFNVAVINSFLTGNWLIKLSLTNLWLVTLFGVSFFVCRMATSLGIGVALLGFFLSLSLGGMASFTYQGVLVPWLEFALYGALNCAGLLSLRFYNLQMANTRLRNVLTGLVAAETLANLKDTPRIIDDDPTEHVVTVMFIDIVRFSKASELSTPMEAFKKLKSTVALLTEVIHQHGGILDRTMGDGLLCFFGFNYVTNSVTPNHADRAIECAQAIQRKLVLSQLGEANLNAFQAVRIGINTCSVFLGNLGDNRRVDITLIGAGVNFAARLETSAETFLIMIGSTTKALLTNPAYRKMLHKRYLQVKNEEEMFEAYELDAFHGDPDVKHRATQLFRDQFNLQRSSERILLKEVGTLQLNSAHGEARVINMSLGGMGVEMGQYLARGVRFRAEFKSTDRSIQSEIDAMGIQNMIVSIRWGKPYLKDGAVVYSHGLQFETLGTEQKERLLEICSKLLVDGSRPALKSVAGQKSA